MSKIKILKTFYHVYKEKLSIEQAITTKLEENNLIINKYIKGKEYNIVDNDIILKNKIDLAVSKNYCEVVE